jgi:hypothetical protein
MPPAFTPEDMAIIGEMKKVRATFLPLFGERWDEPLWQRSVGMEPAPRPYGRPSADGDRRSRVRGEARPSRRRRAVREDQHVVGSDAARAERPDQVAQGPRLREPARRADRRPRLPRRQGLGRVGEGRRRWMARRAPPRVRHLGKLVLGASACCHSLVRLLST